jgi:hypothetical protein
MTAPDYFICGNRTIANVVQGNPTIVTTLEPHLYQTGLVVRFIVPLTSGMVDLNNLTGEIIVSDNFTFSVPIDSTNFPPFIPVVNPADLPFVPQVVAIAENALTLTCAEVNNNNILPEIVGPIPLNP